jgi:uncharacterized membrane protein
VTSYKGINYWYWIQKIANLVDFKFKTADGANQALELAKLLRSQYILELFDAAAVSWSAKAKKLQTQDFGLTLGWSTLDGAFREMLFGLIFFKPFHSLAEGIANEAIPGKITYYGNPDSFTKSGREKITKTRSVISLLTGDSTTDKVVDTLKQLP